MRAKPLFSIPALIIAVLLFQFAPYGAVQSAAAASRCNAVTFIADVTIPDGSILTPGQAFTKTWRLKNSGTCTWTSAYAPVFESGSPLGASAASSMPASLAPGQTVDVSVNMTAPTASGHYRGYWKLKDASGNKFGLGTAANLPFWVDINVSSSSSATPTPVTGTQLPPPQLVPGTVLDFSNSCLATWVSGAGSLPCQGTDGDARGFVLPVTNPRLENGAIDNASALVLFPQNKYNGYIQGTYPEVAIQAGDRFQGIVNCAYGFSCYVTFRLDYTINNAPPKIFWTWSEKNEGKFSRYDKDLSSLAGKNVKFTLTLLSAGPTTGDRALWSQPRIVRLSSPPPTPSPTPMPTEAPIVTGATASVVPLNSLAHCGGPNPMDVTGSITTNGPTTVTFHWEMGGDQTNATSDESLTFTSAGTLPIQEGVYKVDCGNYSAHLVVTSPNTFDAITYYSVFEATPTPTAAPTPTQ